MRTLYLNMSGSDVISLQSALNALGFTVGHADGVYGPLTEAQVKAYQAKNGLTADGIAGPLTLKKLGLDQATPPSPVHYSSPHRICQGDSIVHGIDVSSYQPSCNWQQVAASGNKFAIIKSSEGLTVHDRTFKDHWAGAKAAGIIRAPYHFFHPAQDPVQQANSMLSVVQLEHGDLPCVVDVEWADGLKVLGQHGADAALQMLKILEAKTGVVPMLYTAASFFTGMNNMGDFSRYPLWVANYGVTCPTIPAAWSNWTMWQYTDHEAVPGIGKIDASLFNGSMADLVKLCK